MIVHKVVQEKSAISRSMGALFLFKARVKTNVSPPDAKSYPQYGKFVGKLYKFTNKFPTRMDNLSRRPPRG